MRRHGNSGGSDDSGEDGGVGGWAVAAVLAAKGGVAETAVTLRAKRKVVAVLVAEEQTAVLWS